MLQAHHNTLENLPIFFTLQLLIAQVRVLLGSNLASHRCRTRHQLSAACVALQMMRKV